jgi:hypothetical protein
MTKFFLPMVVSNIVIAMAFLQFNVPITAETSNVNQLDALSLARSTESNNDLEVAYSYKPKAGQDEKSSVLTATGFSLKLVNATVKGTSTLHDWESEITVMEGKGSFQSKNGVLSSINNAEIKVLVRGIKSEKGRKMDNKTYETFQSDKYPFIVYSFDNAEVVINDARAVSIETVGNLSMSGASKSISLLAKGKELPNGDLQLTVSKTIKMTDFNMKPPVMFLGTIKVGDEITVNFDLVLSKD